MWLDDQFRRLVTLFDRFGFKIDAQNEQRPQGLAGLLLAVLDGIALQQRFDILAAGLRRDGQLADRSIMRNLCIQSDKLFLIIFKSAHVHRLTRIAVF